MKNVMLDSVNIINKVQVNNNYFSMPTTNYTDNYIKLTYERKNKNFISDSIKSIRYNFDKIIKKISDNI